MAETENAPLEEDDDVVVVMTDDEGHEFYYEEEMIIPVGEEKYALLVGIHDEETESEHGCGCGCEEGDEDVLIAKVIVNEKGEEEYVEPTDEEFAAVQEAYEAILAEEDSIEDNQE